MRLHDTRECEDFFLDKIFYVMKIVYLEGITNSEVEGVAALEMGNIIEARLFGFVRQVEGDTPVETEHKEVEVVTKAETCAYSHLTEQVLCLETSGDT